MLKGLIIALCGAWLAAGSAVSKAETLQTSTTTMDCTESCTKASSALQPFDGSLGTLTGISLEVTGSKTSYVTAYPIDPNSPASMQWSYSGPMTISVNGTDYSFNISGDETLSVGNQFAYPFTASGSGSFAIDPSLFSSFIGTSNQCNPFFPTLVGVCVDGGPIGFAPGTISFTSDNVSAPKPIDGEVDASFTLTYLYIPFGAVPEPSTWAMMLFGMGAIGMAMRRQARRDKALPLAWADQRILGR